MNRLIKQLKDVSKRMRGGKPFCDIKSTGTYTVIMKDGTQYTIDMDTEVFPTIKWNKIAYVCKYLNSNDSAFGRYFFEDTISGYFKLGNGSDCKPYNYMSETYKKYAKSVD